MKSTRIVHAVRLALMAIACSGCAEPGGLRPSETTKEHASSGGATEERDVPIPGQAAGLPSDEEALKLVGDPHAAECATQRCRPAALHKVRMNTEHARVYINTEPRSPYIERKKDGTEFVRVFIDDKIEIAGTLVHGKLTNLQAGPRGSLVEPHIDVHMFQGDPNTNEGADVFLVLKSTFPQTVRMKFYMGLPPAGVGEMHLGVRYQYTASCPLRPNIALYEHWPHGIYSVVLTEPTIVANDGVDGTTCK